MRFYVEATYGINSRDLGLGDGSPSQRSTSPLPKLDDQKKLSDGTVVLFSDYDQKVIAGVVGIEASFATAAVEEAEDRAASTIKSLLGVTPPRANLIQVFNDKGAVLFERKGANR